MREDVAVGRGVVVQQGHHGTDENLIGIGIGFLVGACVIDSEEFPPQPLDQHARYVAAAVCAHIDYQTFFADLRVVPLDKLADTIRAHVGNVNVSDASAGSCFNLASIVVNPVEINQASFVGDRTI